MGTSAGQAQGSSPVAADAERVGGDGLDDGRGTASRPSPERGVGAGGATLYELNTRVHLAARSLELGRPATLDDVPDTELDRLAALGFDWVWLLSVWRTGAAGRAVARTDPGLRREFAAALPDLRDEDVAGSGFAITAYQVAPELGGEPALARLRGRMAARGMRLMLDFVPNHTALDHPWASAHPERYVRGTAAELAREPGNWTPVTVPSGDRIVLAHGRDPYFPGWTDTLQLDYANPDTVAAMTGELASIAARCDGVRCDMAMLPLPDVFERTWGRRALPFWPTAIARARSVRPDFLLAAEVYWDLEAAILDQGFDLAYDKRLYDRLAAGGAASVRDHLGADAGYQSRLLRFLENHDEPRAAAVFVPDRHLAAAVVAYLAPGSRLFHGGQLEGHRVRVPVQLTRGPRELRDGRLADFYEALLGLLADPLVRDGSWRLLELGPAWGGNPSHEGMVAFAWRLGERRLAVVVNLAPTRGQAYAREPLDELRGVAVRLADRLTGEVLERDADDLADRGLYVDLPPWGRHVLEAAAKAGPPVPG